jgi:hypothetical protein
MVTLPHVHITSMVRSIAWMILLVGPLSAGVRTVWQTLHSYDTIVEPAHNGRQDRHKVNPFLSYTNIGTDFGFVGPAENLIGWQSGQIGVSLGRGANEWAGMWHSLSRLARMKDAKLNFSAFYPVEIQPRFQPKINGLRAMIRGRGTWKIDLTDENNRVLWSQSRQIQHDAFAEVAYDLPTELLSSVKYLTWIAEPGSDLDVDRIDLRMQTPDVDEDQWWFLASYAKALTCWSESTGTVRDRAHIDDGSFDSVSSTGMFCLATAAAAREGIVSSEFASDVLRKSHTAISPLRGPYGLLPHFIRRGKGGALELHPGTEYSTIDTSLFDLSQIMAASMLKEEKHLLQAVRDAKSVRYRELINESGYISHGVMDDGKTIIPYQWKDWGGETALVLLMLHLSDAKAKAGMSSRARPHQGTGFIAEIQSLFFPDFDSEKADAISGANWHAVRKKLLHDQKAYLMRNHPDAVVTRSGIFGFSAGEQRHGFGYAVGGVDLPGQTVLHPHYMLMAAAIDEEPSQLRNVLRSMEQKGWLTPLGLVENVSAIDGQSLPMIGSLNACFEAIGAYHFMKRSHRESNAIYHAAREVPELRDAMKIFYP